MTRVDTTVLAQAVNTLGAFCGRRDVDELSASRLAPVLGGRADVVILFGASLLSGTAVLADAVRAGVAATTVIVGGEGHTTSALRTEFARRHGGDDAPRSEAEILDAHLRNRYASPRTSSRRGRRTAGTTSPTPSPCWRSGGCRTTG